MMTDKMKEIIETYQDLGPVPVTHLTPEAARQLPTLADAVLGVMAKHLSKKIFGPVLSIDKIEHRVIQGLGGDILVRIYSPKAEENLPVLLYFHGGGWVISNLDTYDSSCRSLCQATGFIVVSVAYRQAPEHPFPAAPRDALSAYKWVLSQARSFGGDPHHVAVAGESAGGNLATVLCLMARDQGLPQPAHQILIYPVVDCNFETASYQMHRNAQPLNADMMKWFWGHYLNSPVEGEQTYASPLHADLRGLAPATVITAEIDPLCSEGEAYAWRLIEAGVDTQVKRFDGVTHEFFGMTALLPEAREALQLIVERLKFMKTPDRQTKPFYDPAFDLFLGAQTPLI